MAKVDRGSKAGAKLSKMFGWFAKCSNCKNLSGAPGQPYVCELTGDRMFEASYYICESWSWHGDAENLEKLKKGAQ